MDSSGRISYYLASPSAGGAGHFRAAGETALARCLEALPGGGEAVGSKIDGRGRRLHREVRRLPRGLRLQEPAPHRLEELVLVALVIAARPSFQEGT